MTQPVLRSRRLVLRPFLKTDIDALHAILSDPGVMRYWGDRHSDRAQTAAFVTGTIAADPARTCDFVIERDGTTIGKAGMWQTPEIGFFVHPDHQRQGIAAEALGMIIPHLFDSYDLPALTADVDPRNLASLTLLQRLGFTETHRAARTIQIDGVWCDSVYLERLRPD